MSEEGTAPKRMGRPRKSPEKGKRQNYTFRMSDSTRDVVLRDAEAAGRSISEELERRIELSIAQKEREDFLIKLNRHLDRTIISMILKMCGGSDTIIFAGLFISDLKYSISIVESENTTDGKWFENPESVQRVIDQTTKRASAVIQRYAEHVAAGSLNILPEEILSRIDGESYSPRIPDNLGDITVTQV